MLVSNEQRLKYLRRRLLEVTRVRSLQGEEFFSTALTIGHQLKGNSETFGVEQLAPIASLLEQAAQTRDSDSAHNALDQIERLVLAELASMAP